MDTLELGAKIRAYRKEKRMSLQALAEQVHITPSMLSQIERDLANPSINTLKLISKALNIPLFQLFTTSGNMDTIVRRGNRKKIHMPNAGASYEYELLTPDTNGAIEFILQKFKANSDSGDAIQSHEGEEVAYVLNGQLTLVMNDSEFTLHEGDSVRIPPMTPHYWSNPTNWDATMIFAVTPPSF